MIRKKKKRVKKSKNNGFFITFEGVEGVGKSTHQKKLASYLKKQGYKVKITREPGGTNIGLQIRNILLHPENKNMNSLTELFLYLADRIQHISELILPYLNKGYIVISDRHGDSTIAYQAAGRNLDMNLVKKLNKLAVSNVSPDLTFLMCSDLKTTILRAKQLSKEYKGGDRIENESFRFHKKVQKKFEKIQKSSPGRVIKIDLLDTVEQTQAMIRKKCMEKLKKR